MEITPALVGLEVSMNQSRYTETWDPVVEDPDQRFDSLDSDEEMLLASRTFTLDPVAPLTAEHKARFQKMLSELKLSRYLVQEGAPAKYSFAGREVEPESKEPKLTLVHTSQWESGWEPRYR